MTNIFTLLRTFDAVAEHNGFTAAANALNIGQPTITTQIKALEELYGVELILRRGRRVELSEIGETLQKITQRIFVLKDEAHELLENSGQLRTGHLRISAVGSYYVTSVTRLFRQRYPDYDVSVELGNTTAAQAKLLDLTSDVAIVAHEISDPRIHTVPLGVHEVVLFVNRDHPWFGRDSIKLRELDRESVVVREPGSETRRALEAAIESANIDVNKVMEIGSRECVWHLVKQGMGIGVVTEIEYIPDPNLCKIRIEDSPVKLEFRLGYLAERSRSLKIVEVIRIANELL